MNNGQGSKDSCESGIMYTKHYRDTEKEQVNLRAELIYQFRLNYYKR